MTYQPPAPVGGTKTMNIPSETMLLLVTRAVQNSTKENLTVRAMRRLYRLASYD